MPEISITVSQYTVDLLEELSEESGQSKSSLAAECLKQGLISEVEQRKTVVVYRKLKKSVKEEEEGKSK
ncbi:MAG: hypothetical protein ACKO87_17155 [Dolichospermum sp.]